MSTVKNQTELDAALARGDAEVIIKSPEGVWLRVTSTGSSRVVAWDSSRVEAWDSSRVEAWGSSSVEARGSSRVVAWDSSSVVAWGSSRVEAWGYSRVEARDSSSVEAWDSSRVEARDSSRVEAGKYTAVHLHSGHATVNGGVIIDITKLDLNHHEDWADYHGVTQEDGNLIVYKAVDGDLKSGRGFAYPVGETVIAPDWSPEAYCGNGLHFSPSPAQAKQYHPEATRFLKCAVAITDLVILDGAITYVTPKLKARAAKVLCEVDLHGDEVRPDA